MPDGLAEFGRSSLNERATVADPPISEDSLFGGRVRLFQPSRGSGYRANVDAILLGAFAAEGRRVRLAVDLGSGVGAVGLTLFHFAAAERVDFIEREPALVALCQDNLKANGHQGRGRVRVGDLNRPLSSIAPEILHAAGLVVANPPYVAPERDGRADGRRPSGRLEARRGDLVPFVRAAAEALGRRGRACMVYPAHALLELTTAARKVGLEPKRLRFVHGKATRPARVALVELALARPGGLVVQLPLIETDAAGHPTPELTNILGHASG